MLMCAVDRLNKIVIYVNFVFNMEFAYIKQLIWKYYKKYETYYRKII